MDVPGFPDRASNPERKGGMSPEWAGGRGGGVPLGLYRVGKAAAVPQSSGIGTRSSL